MSRTLIALLSCLAVAGGATAVAGCGAEDAAGVDVAKAAQSTASKKTAKVDMTMRVSGSGLPSGLTLTATGVTDLTRPRGTLSFDLGSVAQAAGVPSGLLGTDSTMELRFDGAQAYAKLPDIAMLRSALGGKTWVSANLAELAPAFGIDTKGLGALMQVDPSSQMKTITSLKTIKKVGDETLDGADVTHFKGSYTLKDVVAALPASQRAAVQSSLDKLAKLGGGKAALDAKQDAELWIDKDDVLRKMQASADLPGPTGSSLGRVAITYHLTQFGTPLNVTAPASSQTYVVTPAAVRKLLSGAMAP